MYHEAFRYQVVQLFWKYETNCNSVRDEHRFRLQGVQWCQMQ